MQVELGKLQDASRKELDILRDSSKLMFERENRILRESRQDALHQVETLQKKLGQVEQAYDDKV
jgi:hypothetical protein